MALFHLSVTQTKRSAGQSAIASAAYRAGERLYSEYYGEYSDYTRKGGVICSDILLPSHAPPEYADRQTLWNAVEKAERGKNAQLAYSFDIALQNEFSLEENIALARQFLLENFVSRGMVVDFAVHQPDREDGGIPNPHFHVLCPIRPIKQDGKWGLKQRRVYELDEDGNRIRDQNGEFIFNAVPTTDWGSPETLEYWRQTWAELCNAKFAEKGLDVRIDHRSYERQGVELLPTVHEGATVRAMEKKGIRTEKGEFNRWIKATNAVIRDIKKKIALLFDWIAEAKAELAKPQAPDLVSLLNAYYTSRRAGAYSQKGKVSKKVGRTGKNRFTGEMREPIDKAYYICQTYNRMGCKVCSSHKIEARDLYNLVLKDIQELAAQAMKDADAFYQRLSRRMEHRYLVDASQTEKERLRLEARNQEIDGMFLSLYTDKAKGILTEQRFVKLTAALEQEQESNQKRLHDLAMMQGRADAQESEVRTFIKEIRRYAAIEELDEAVLNRLISRILIGEIKKIDGQRTQEVKIIYNFVGEMSR